MANVSRIAGWRVGEKCPCVSWHPHAGKLEAIELAEPDCELCDGTGRVGAAEAVLEERNTHVAEPFRALLNGISALEVVGIEEAGRA